LKGSCAGDSRKAQSPIIKEINVITSALKISLLLLNFLVSNYPHLFPKTALCELTGQHSCAPRGANQV
jgi:hypothetical protein